MLKSYHSIALPAVLAAITRTRSPLLAFAAVRIGGATLLIAFASTNNPPVSLSSVVVLQAPVARRSDGWVVRRRDAAATFDRIALKCGTPRCQHSASTTSS